MAISLELSRVPPCPTESSEIQFKQLSGPEFDDAVYGSYDAKNSPLIPAWLQHPKLLYYRQRGGMTRPVDSRVFFLATAPSPEEPSKQHAVGALEIDFETADNTVVGIKYVSVADAYRQQGLAKKLYEMLIEHLKADGLRLYRTRPGKDTPSQFTASITNLLEQSGVDWYCREL